MAIDALRYLYRIGHARMVENEFCTCLHHLIQHDENAEKCTVPGCTCSAFTPEAIPITFNVELVRTMGELLAKDIAQLMIGLYQQPLSEEGITDALTAMYYLASRIRLLQYTLHYALQYKQTHLGGHQMLKHILCRLLCCFGVHDVSEESPISIDQASGLVYRICPRCKKKYTI